MLCPPLAGPFCTPGTSFCKLVSPSIKDSPCQFKFWPMVHHHHISKILAIYAYIKLCHPRAGPFMTQELNLRKGEYRPKKVPCYFKMHLAHWFVRRRFYKIPNISPNVASYWVPKGASPFICANLNPHSLKMIPTKYCFEINAVVLER